MSITVSHSEAENFSLCKRKHFYSYGLQIQKPGSDMPLPLLRGILGHEGLRAYYTARMRGVDKPYDVACEAVYKYSDHLSGSESTEQLKADQDLKDAVTLLVDNHHSFWKDDGWEILEVESEGLYPLIEDELYTQIRPDLVVRIPGKGIAVVDHKFVYDFKPQIEYEINPQLPKYLIGLRHRGIEVKYALYNQLRYRELKVWQPENVFRRTFIELSQHRLDQTMREHARISGEIAGLKSLSLEDWEGQIYRTANMMVCRSCSFKELCANDIHGRPRDLMIKHFYAPKKPRIMEAVEVDE